MQENVSLIREINDLRKESNFLKHERQQQRLNVSKQKKLAQSSLPAAESSPERTKEYAKEMELNKQEINALKRRIEEAQRLKLGDAGGQMFSSQEGADESPHPDALGQPTDSMDEGGGGPDGSGED